MDRNHYNMNKFGRPSESAFRTVKNAILKIADTFAGGKSFSLSEADTLIRTEHYTPDKLRIERLSRSTLPIDHCYINLAIVEQPSSAAGVSEGLSERRPAASSSPPSLLRRLNIEAPDKTSCVDLLEIFNPRKGRNGDIKRPRRVLIRGRAGVGKTTLCKKIVHEFLLGTWNNLFSRILWLPLRELKTWNSKKYNFKKLFHHVFFAEFENSHSLAKKMDLALGDPDSGRTLFVLDGLDEVSREWKSTDRRYRFLLRLLNWPDVIITSRPQGDLALSRAHSLDLELETLGFYPDQVKEYIGNAFTDQNIASDVQNFLQEQDLLRDLMRIPIMLDALCVTWTNGFGKRLASQTMTGVYEAIEESLWKNLMPRLDKGCAAVVIDTKVNDLTSPDIQRLFEDQVYLLETLAFTGMVNDIIDFDSHHVNALSAQFQFVGETLRQLPFLRISDPSANGYQSYHFIHLTFQEYFAARYFARHWKARRPLVSLALGTRKSEETDPVAFLLKHKYEPHYDVVWRFAAGLLDAEGGAESLQFFQTLEKPPRDILGPAHQRLVMHCLSEASMDMGLRGQLEGKLSQWLLFQCEIGTTDLNLAYETEFPEHALDIALTNASSDTQRRMLLGSLIQRQRILPKGASLIEAWLEDGVSNQLKHELCKMIGRIRSNMPDNILKHLIPLLVDRSRDIRDVAASAFCTQSNLAQEILKAIIVQLAEADEEVGDSSISVLCKQAYIPGATLQAVTVRLEDKDPRVRRFYFRILSKLSSSSPEIHNTVILGLSDEDWAVRMAILDALSGQSELPLDLHNAVLVQLADKHVSVKMAALYTIMRQSKLPTEIYKTVVVWLTDKNLDIRRATLNTLSRLSELPVEIRDAVVARLTDEDWRVRLAAVRTLQSSLQLDEVRKSVAARLADEKAIVRVAAIRSLSWQSELPIEIREAIIALLTDERAPVRAAAIDMLNKPSLQLNEILENIIARLEDESSDVRGAAIELLGGKSDLNNEVLKALIVRLADKDDDVIRTATKALNNQPSLPDEIMQAVAARLKDPETETRVSALNVICNQPNLRTQIINAVGVQLTSSSAEVREAACLALENRPNLLEEVVKSLVLLLYDDDNEYIREAALSALGDKPHLDEKILKKMVSLLDDEISLVMQTASGVLSKRSDLSDEILRIIARPLKSGEDIRLDHEAELAEIALQGHTEYYSSLLDCPYAEKLYSVLLPRSFHGQWSWYIEGGTSCVNMPNGRREIPIRSMQEFESTIRKAREDFAEMPIVASLWDDIE
jgi:HEAT repeat protein